MDFLSCVKHIVLDYELGCGGFLFGRFKVVYRILGLSLLFGFGLKFLFSDQFCSSLVRSMCDFSGKSRNFKIGFCSKGVIGGNFGMSKLLKAGFSVPFIDANTIEKVKLENLNSSTGVDGETESDQGDEFDAKNNEDEYNNGEDVEYDVETLRELLKIERQRVNAAVAEVVKERAASATAAEEAMAMILRLQNEKSKLEMEWNQYRRLAEEKQIHDQHVIRSLQCLVWQHGFKAQEEEEEEEYEEGNYHPSTTPCICRHKLKLNDDDDDDGTHTCFNGNILDALENVFYSSRDSDCLSPS